jgi:hypothetical protein
MAQVADNSGTFTAGIATGKGKYWETRYASLREYEAFATNIAERYWFPPASISGQLLPQVLRGRNLTQWPDAEVVAIDLDYALLGGEWSVDNVGPLEFLEFRAPSVASASSVLPLEVVAIQSGVEVVVWRGTQALTGQIASVGGDLSLRRGFGEAVSLSEVLSQRPPTIFFSNGTTVHGNSIFESRPSTYTLPRNLLIEQHDWSGVDICSETRAKAASEGIGISVHEALEKYLKTRPRLGKHRWIIFNDGAGEFADYVVIQVDWGQTLGVHVGLWHAKPAGGEPSVRVTDLQEVIAQAIKSRRWLTDVGFWKLLGDRLSRRSAPHAVVVEGNSKLLDVLCGNNERWANLSFQQRRPIVVGQVGIAQPGLARAVLQEELDKQIPSISAVQSCHLLSVFHDSVSMVARTVTVLCSKDKE